MSFKDTSASRLNGGGTGGGCPKPPVCLPQTMLTTKRKVSSANNNPLTVMVELLVLRQQLSLVDSTSTALAPTRLLWVTCHPK